MKATPISLANQVVKLMSNVDANTRRASIRIATEILDHAEMLRPFPKHFNALDLLTKQGVRDVHKEKS